MDYDHFDALTNQVEALRRFGRNLELVTRRGVHPPRDELWVMLGEAERQRCEVLTIEPGIDRDDLLFRLEGATAWLWFLYTHGATLSTLTAASVERIVTAPVPTEGRTEHFTEALMVLARARRTARVWKMAREVGFALRADVKASPEDATLRGLWAVYRFLVPVRVLADYREPPAPKGPNVVKSMYPGGLPGLGRRR